MLLIAGVAATAGVTVNVTAFETTSPGFTTRTCQVPVVPPLFTEYVHCVAVIVPTRSG